MKGRLLLLLALFLLPSTPGAFAQTQLTELGASIRSAKLFRQGDQSTLPVITLNGNETLQLVFDDLTTRVRNYYYTYQLCNADWSPSMLHPFEYIKGFQNMRISLYRNSSIANVHYVNYQATFPERNSYPNRSGNYLLKVFLDSDTSKLVFTKRFVVVNPMSSLAAQIQQPFNARFYRTYQKLNIAIQTDNSLRVTSPNDLKVVVLQNNNWETSLYMDRPTIYRGNYFEYSDEGTTAMPAAREFRWVDLRSLRLLSDRMQSIKILQDTVHVFMKPDPSRGGQPYLFYRDLNGAYMIENAENLNPFWQGDYAYVHFSFAPPGNRPIPGNDVYIFGEMTDYASRGRGKMEFNEATGLYERTMLLKQGYYSYNYITRPKDGTGYPDFSQTEGDFWGTENSYTVLVYFRPFGARADEVVGYTSVNSAFQRGF